MNVKIYIVESNENFAETTLVEPSNAIQSPRSLYIGHIGEQHYISTCRALSEEKNS